MKWIGQHIVDLIARFRSDVYLDDVQTGTIASGGNLGIDSNNKIVKAAEASGDITGVDLTAGDGITVVDELNTDAGDYSATVGHADTSSQSSVNNSGRTFIQDLTLDDFGHVTGITSATDSDTQTGTVTSVTVTTDSGSGARYTNSETPSISILGATGVGVTNSSGTITATAVPGEIDHDSLNNFVAAEHYDWASDNSGTATIHSNNITDLHGAGVDGSDNQLLTDGGDGSITSEANLTYDGTDLTVTSSSEGKPVLTLKTTHTTSNKAGELQFLKDAADTEDNEALGSITFYGENEANTNTKFGHIKGAIAESTTNQEGGKISFAVAAHDGEMRNGLIINDGNAEDEIDVTIGDTATSLTTISGTLTMRSTAFVNNSGVIQVATQGTIDHDSLANFVANEHIDWTASSAGTVHSSNLPSLYSHSVINLGGQATMLSTGNWVLPGKPGVNHHTWNLDSGVNTEVNDTTAATMDRRWGHNGIRMPFACIIDGISCGIQNSGGNRQVTIGLFFSRAADSNLPAYGTTSSHSPKLQIHADANNDGGTFTNKASHAEVTGQDIAMAAGDVFYPAIKLTGVTSSGNTDNIYASITVHIKTLIS